MGDFQSDWDYHKHELECKDHVVERVDSKTGLVYFKDGCIEDWS